MGRRRKGEPEPRTEDNSVLDMKTRIGLRRWDIDGLLGALKKFGGWEKTDERTLVKYADSITREEEEMLHRSRFHFVTAKDFVRKTNCFRASFVEGRDRVWWN